MWGSMQGCPKPLGRAGQGPLNRRLVPSPGTSLFLAMTARCDEAPLPLCKLAFAAAQIHQVSRDRGPVTDLLLRPMEVRSGAAKPACSPVLPVSDSASVKKAWGLPQVLQNCFFVQDSLARGCEFFNNWTSKAKRCFSRDAVCRKSDYVSLRQIVRLLTSADISERNVLVSQRLNYAFAN